MDEYELEIDSLRRTLAGMRIEEADPQLIDEYEIELRILRALCDAARRTLGAGDLDPRLARALRSRGFEAWDLPNVYSYVYDVAMDVEADGRDLAALIGEMDFTGELLEAAGEPG